MENTAGGIIEQKRPNRKTGYFENTVGEQKGIRKNEGNVKE